MEQLEVHTVRQFPLNRVYSLTTLQGPPTSSDVLVKVIDCKSGRRTFPPPLVGVFRFV
jgi:hypothetical protein